MDKNKPVSAKFRTKWKFVKKPRLIGNIFIISNFTAKVLLLKLSDFANNRWSKQVFDRNKLIIKFSPNFPHIRIYLLRPVYQLQVFKMLILLLIHKFFGSFWLKTCLIWSVLSNDYFAIKLRAQFHFSLFIFLVYVDSNRLKIYWSE